MGVKQRPYLEADGDEVDCAYFLSESEYVSGFLRLSNPTDTGRVRFLEDVLDLAPVQSEPSLDPVAVTLPDGKLLVEHLCLFAFLCDQPLRPGHIYADGDPDRVDFYASRPEPAAPRRILPLALLPEIEDRVESIVAGWSALLEGAHDLVDHVVNFQLFRAQGT
jgi:hypothetical protein